MSQLIHIKQHIRSIKTTKKLTHAMRLISMSLYSKLEHQKLPLEYHQNAFKNLLAQLLIKRPQWTNPVFFPEDTHNTIPLYVLISATKGFCGGLTNSLFKYCIENLSITKNQTPFFITIGKKATDFVTDKKLGTILDHYHDLNSNNFFDIGRLIAQSIMTKTAPFSSVTIFSSLFKNFFKQKPTFYTLIPFKKDFHETVPSKIIPQSEKEASSVYAAGNDEFIDQEPIWEQDSTDIINTVAQEYFTSSITNIIYQALISEYSSRFVAMDSATTNAEKYLDSLTLQLNKLRQSLITQEVSELSSNLR